MGDLGAETGVLADEDLVVLALGLGVGALALADLCLLFALGRQGRRRRRAHSPSNQRSQLMFCDASQAWGFMMPAAQVAAAPPKDAALTRPHPKRPPKKRPAGQARRLAFLARKEPSWLL